MDTHLHMCLVCIQTHTLPDAGLGREAREVDWIGRVCVHTSQATVIQAGLCYGQGRGVQACFCKTASSGQTHSLNSFLKFLGRWGESALFWLEG